VYHKLVIDEWFYGSIMPKFGQLKGIHSVRKIKNS
jgi:hypothetical protein